jgi:glutathione S-transferase
MTLVIANKNYSSWSMRAWLVMRHFGFRFDEIVIPLDEPDTHTRILVHSPSGKVPCLMVDGMPVWDTLAIIEYLAETAPRKRIWPEAPRARATARSASAEMHAGVTALRRACPMNLRKTFGFRGWGGAEAAADVKRIEAMWARLLERFGGPFLFGEFCAADAMYAPVVARFYNYGLPVSELTRTYMNHVRALPAWQEWRAASLKEPWVMAHNEPDWPDVQKL